MTNPEGVNPVHTNPYSLKASFAERLRRPPRHDADPTTLLCALNEYVSCAVPALSIDTYAAMVYRANRAAGP
ncbi:hypothetical protein [Mycobacterium sp.]|uniref:hypothetical protein n=1 Tax=Mycobacterium sp. TaxID=1785 RepID=UPI0025DBB482|nr:hypothetical protein [Mycobacterium sp.]